MPLTKILGDMDKQVKPEVIKQIISYMKAMPAEHETLVLQCAEHLDKSQSLGAVLSVVYALNEGEFLLKCRHDEDADMDLSKEFEQLLMEGSDKKETAI